jgi:hypothetical protein
VAVSVDAGSARITENTAGARPALFTDGKIVICHLTKGFGGVMSLAPAFTASGEVKVSGPDAEVRGFAFNFIQFQKLRNVSLTYSSGDVNTERILLTVSQPPALSQNPALDSRRAFSPFTSAATADVRLGKATNGMGDHPASKAAAQLTHESGRKCLLRSFTDSREFWTSFVARSPAGAIQYLAHFHWELHYEFALEWELTDLGDFRIKLLLSNSRLNFEAPVPGPPRAPELAGMLASPRGPQANELMDAAIRSAVLGGPPNRMDLGF